MARRWFEIALSIPTPLIDEAAALLDFAGFGGVEIREHGDTADVVVVVDVDACADALATPADTYAPPAEAHASPASAHEKAVAAREAVAILGAGPPRMTELDPKVWTENWKRHFARRTFAGRIEVRPPWEDPTPPSGDLLSIVINPGMAFGTGLHETTASCLELLVEEMRPGARVADVGCGSGILAIAAARLGASAVLATDVDPLAIDAAAENVAANAVADVVRVELEPGEVGIPEWENNARPGLAAAAREAASARQATPNGARGGGFAARGAGAFDLLVANILAETLVEMHSALTSAVRPGGTLVLSGIEGRRLKLVEEAFIRPPWCLARTVTKGDWVSLSLHHIALAEPERTASSEPCSRVPAAAWGARPPGAA